MCDAYCYDIIAIRQKHKMNNFHTFLFQYLLFTFYFDSYTQDVSYRLSMHSGEEEKKRCCYCNDHKLLILTIDNGAVQLFDFRLTSLCDRQLHLHYLNNNSPFDLNYYLLLVSCYIVNLSV